MTTKELKTTIHEIVDRIDNEELLSTIYSFLKTRELSKPGAIWDSLTEKQKKETLLSYEESEDDSNLVQINEVLGDKK